MAKLIMTGKDEILVKLPRGRSWGGQAFVDLRRLAIVYPKRAIRLKRQKVAND
jgi:hypothetical protein